MNIIKIDRASFSTTNVARDYERWIQETNAKLGITSKYAAASISGTDEFTWHEGRLFKRTISGYPEYGVFFHLYRHEEPGEAPSYPEVLCECGSTSFQCGFGSNSCWLKCVNCGRQEEVYSG